MSIFAAIPGRSDLGSMQVRLPLGAWLRVARERRRLAALDERQLRDIGIDPAAAAREAGRPFWDLPAGRRL